MRDANAATRASSAFSTAKPSAGKPFHKLCFRRRDRAHRPESLQVNGADVRDDAYLRCRNLVEQRYVPPGVHSELQHRSLVLFIQLK